MCLIIFAYRPDQRFRLVVAANRDEFHGRPTAGAAFWEDAPDVMAGRDLKRGGTWMGVTKSGRIAAVTNYRDPNDQQPREKSRGFLVSDFLKSDAPPLGYLGVLQDHADEYEGFNLLVGDRDELWWYSNRGGEPRKLSPGVYGLSNHLLDTPWPKVERGKNALQRLLDEEDDLSREQVFQILADDDPAADDELPDTGVGVELERLLSPPFIRAGEYGTRSSTVLIAKQNGHVTFAERRFGSVSNVPRESAFEFRVGS